MRKDHCDTSIHLDPHHCVGINRNHPHGLIIFMDENERKARDYLAQFRLLASEEVELHVWIKLIAQAVGFPFFFSKG